MGTPVRTFISFGSVLDRSKEVVVEVDLESEELLEGWDGIIVMDDNDAISIVRLFYEQSYFRG
jgi:hypothetical protein